VAEAAAGIERLDAAVAQLIPELGSWLNRVETDERP